MNASDRSRAARILLLVALGVLFLRLASAFRPIWNVDEGTNACVANVILNGGLPFRDAIEHKPPLTYYAYALGFAVCGRNNMVAIHILLSLLVAGLSAIVFACGRLASNYSTGLWAAFIFAILSFSLFAPMDMMAAHTEWFLILFTSLGAYLLLRACFGANSWLLLISGACYGFAILSKQPAVLDFGVAIVFLILLTLFRRRSRTTLTRHVATLGVGCLLPVLGTLMYFYFRDGLPDAIFYMWTYNTTYYVPALDHLDRLRPLLVILKRLVLWFCPVALLCLAGMYHSIREFFRVNRSSEGSSADCNLFFALWFLLSMVGASLSGRGFGHYFIQVLPALSLLSGAALDLLFVRAQAVREKKRANGATPTQLHLFRFGAVAAICLLVVPVAARYRQSLARQDRQENELVAYLRSASGHQDPAFVWGFYPELYVLADRMPASRYVYCNFLTGLIPWTNARRGIDTTRNIVPGSWDILLRELDRSKPLFIVDTSPGGHRGYGKYPPEAFPLLQEFIQRYYRMDREIRGERGEVSFRVFRRSDVSPRPTRGNNEQSL